MGAPIAQAIGNGTILEESPQTLYAVGSAVGSASSSLYEIAGYYASPKVSTIGDSGALLADLAISPKTGAAYGISTTDLYEINLQSGNATEIGPLGSSGIDALAFSPSGTLYAMSSGSSDLYTINTKTGHATVDFGTGYTPTGGIAFGPDGALYLTTSAELVRIKLSTKKATVVGTTGVSNLFGLAFGSNGTIYAGQTSNGGKTVTMYKIDDTTGHATRIATIAGASKLGLEGLSF